MKPRLLETILALDHHSATATTLREMRDKPALLSTHGIVLAEDMAYLYVATGGNGFAGDDLQDCDSIDCVAILKSTIVKRTPHGPAATILELPGWPQ